ncbi:MAG: 2-5 ligase family protein [Novosphingobium sp.]|nr:2-5 ligase family protein [Novosphingobium sp.]
MTAAPIIVSALFGREDFAWLNGLRIANFPAERNQLDAHLTLFHHLPPSIAPELKGRLADLVRASPPAAAADGLINLGRGVAIRIHSPALDVIRNDLASAFSDLLIPQDAAGWRPHVTIQNKVQPTEARALYASLASGFRPRPLRIIALAAWWYRGGPWELISRHPFR